MKGGGGLMAKEGGQGGGRAGGESSCKQLFPPCFERWLLAREEGGGKWGNKVGQGEGCCEATGNESQLQSHIMKKKLTATSFLAASNSWHLSFSFSS